MARKCGDLSVLYVYEVVWSMHGQMLINILYGVADFPFGPVRSIHPSSNKLLCCDFSTQGKFLAAAGHEKKVLQFSSS